MSKGLKYTKFRWRDSDCYELKVDLSRYDIRPVMARQEFPFSPQRQPVFDAINQGAVACASDGYNITQWNVMAGGLTDQPQHTLVLNREIWTTGLGNGGAGFRIADGHAGTQDNRVVSMHVWRPDGTAFEVDSVNLRRVTDKISAFTPRGGTNAIPKDGKCFTVLGNAAEWLSLKGGIDSREMDVIATYGKSYAIPVADGTIVLESPWPLKLHAGDRVRWTQRLGGEGTHTIVSGWPELLRGGVNVVHDLLAVPSHGPDNWLIRKNPRTAIGVDETGTTAFILVVQGRTPNSYRPHDHSKGLRLRELATLLHERGVHDAINLDGGGSAFLWLKDGGTDLGGTVVAPGCYNRKGTVADGRPGHFSTSVFLKEE
jgi:hypothetical protein